MLKLSSVPAKLDALPSRACFHVPESNSDLEDSLARAASNLDVRPGFPDSILELDDVFVVPGASTSCLYDSHGARIDASCVRRGGALDDYIGAEQTRITPPTDYATVSAPVLYLSMYFRHWGHFLTESISRLWARSAHREFAVMDVGFAGFTHGFKRMAPAREFLCALAPPPRVLAPRGIVRVAKCFVPAPSFVNRAAAHAGHLAAAREVATALLPPGRRQTSARPVYLSRSRLANVDRVIVNEREFEAILARGGAIIAHPQEMSLSDQIALFNAHPILIGCAGSALHNLMFTLEGREVTTFVLSEPAVHGNCLMVDAIVGNASHYFWVLRDAAREVAATAAKPLRIDIDAATKFLIDFGIIGRGARDR